MTAEPTTAAEKTAPAGSMVMLGDVLGLGRVGGGSGWRQGLRRARRPGRLRPGGDATPSAVPAARANANVPLTTTSIDDAGAAPGARLPLRS